MLYNLQSNFITVFRLLKIYKSDTIRIISDNIGRHRQTSSDCLGRPRRILSGFGGGGLRSLSAPPHASLAVPYGTLQPIVCASGRLYWHTSADIGGLTSHALGDFGGLRAPSAVAASADTADIGGHEGT